MIKFNSLIDPYINGKNYFELANAFRDKLPRFKNLNDDQIKDFDQLETRQAQKYFQKHWDIEFLYKGEMLKTNSKNPHGRGLLVLNGGQKIIEGQFKNGLPCGHCRMINFEICYEGIFNGL